VTNRSQQSLPLRLEKIHAGLQEVIRTFHPDEFAIESAFYGKNAQSALKLGHARGVCLLAAVQANLPTAEYSPREVKKSIVGNGNASKEQVQFMIKALLHIQNTPMMLDASDAIAVAMCHLHRILTPVPRHADWSAYVAAHPERVRS
jgi:crossover junction endodeoxyribonuclease RuvC